MIMFCVFIVDEMEYTGFEKWWFYLDDTEVSTLDVISLFVPRPIVRENDDD